MIGGQVLIIFVGGAAFRITPLNGKEWGLSIGLGAISIPFGALIRLFPDEWAAACVPELPWLKRWLRRSATKKEAKKAAKKAKKDADKDVEGAPKDTRESSDEEFIPPTPLRALTSLRGKRAESNIRRSFKQYMKDQKNKAKAKAHDVVTGSKMDVSVVGGGPVKKSA